MVAASPFIIVPLYLYPSSGAWNPLYKEIAAQPSVDFQIIVNPNSGPGGSPGSYPDSNWISTLSKLNAYDNVQLIGYVPTDYADRNITLVQEDIATYADWSNYGAADISVSGIFFDESPDDDDSDTLTYLQSIAEYARQEFSDYDERVVTFNPGAPVPAEYYDYADNIIVYEDVYSNFQISPTGYPIADIESSQRAASTIMINSFPNNAKKQKNYVNTILNDGFSGIWISSYNDYSKFPQLWTNLGTQVAAAQ